LASCQISSKWPKAYGRFDGFLNVSRRAAIFHFQKFEILITVGRPRGASSRHHSTFHQNGQTDEEILRFNGFQNGGRPLSGTLEFKFFNERVVKGLILHHRTEFCVDQ